MTVPLKTVLLIISGLENRYKGDKCDNAVNYLQKTNCTNLHCPLQCY